MVGMSARSEYTSRVDQKLKIQLFIFDKKAIIYVALMQ